MRSISAAKAEEILLTVAHDLRQPLGNIELSACYLNLLLGEPRGKAQEQIQNIEQQVDRASRILGEAIADLGRLRAQEPLTESRSLTKSTTGAVT